MPDKNLTDNEIIKACEWYLTIANRVHSVTLSKDEIHELYDLINRQKAENERLQELVNNMGDYFPACINCEGKTEFGERTDKCVYLIDNTNYCIKRGITNIVAIQNENRQLKQKLETAKAEARKEFAERVYKFICDTQNWGVLHREFLENGECYWLKQKFDNLLNELVGDK